MKIENPNKDILDRLDRLEASCEAHKALLIGLCSLGGEDTENRILQVRAEILKQSPRVLHEMDKILNSIVRTRDQPN